MMTHFYIFTSEHNMIMDINLMQLGMTTNEAAGDSHKTRIKPIILF